MAKTKEEYNTYMREYMLRRYHRRMQAARAYLGGCCWICEITENLELDHIDRTTKSFTVGGTGWNCSEKKFWEEVDKCQLLCPEHHLTKGRAAGDVKPAAKHGSAAMYGYHKCCCSICRQGNAVRKTRYQKNGHYEGTCITKKTKSWTTCAVAVKESTILRKNARGST